MCTVSVITDYGRNRIPYEYWTAKTWPPFRELVKAAEEFDKVTDQPDCIDPIKAEWMQSIEERIQKLEAAAFRRT